MVDDWNVVLGDLNIYLGLGNTASYASKSRGPYHTRRDQPLNPLRFGRTINALVGFIYLTLEQSSPEVCSRQAGGDEQHRSNHSLLDCQFQSYFWIYGAFNLPLWPPMIVSGSIFRICAVSGGGWVPS